MARKLTGRRIVAGVLLALVAGLGCNPLLIPTYFFQGLRNGKIPSEYDFFDKAKAAKKKKEIKVVVLSERGRSLTPEFVSAERTITTMFVNQLRINFTQNKEHVVVVPPGDVEKFKREHDDWRAMDTSEIAKQFEADYVIDVEIAQISIYERGTRELYHGHCRIPMRIVDADKNAPEIFPPHDYETDYPSGGEMIPATEMSSDRFQQKFYSKIAVDMAALFSAIETRRQFE
jgi:hypothetical protein